MKTLGIRDLTTYQWERAAKLSRGVPFAVYQSSLGLFIEMDDHSHWQWIDNDWEAVV